MNKKNTRLAKFGIVIVLFILMWLYYNSHSGVESFWEDGNHITALDIGPQAFGTEWDLRQWRRGSTWSTRHAGTTDCGFCDLGKDEWEGAAEAMVASQRVLAGGGWTAADVPDVVGGGEREREKLMIVTQRDICGRCAKTRKDGLAEANAKVLATEASLAEAKARTAPRPQRHQKGEQSVGRGEV